MDARTQDQLIDHLIENSIVDESTGCILWQGCVAGKGYGVTCWQSKQVYIHRIAYHFEYPDEVLDVVRHTCDTPNCWNLDHLVNGTTQDNVDDKVNKKRHIFGSANYNSAFTEEQIVHIRNSSLDGAALGRLYKVTTSTIHYVRTRKTWKHVA